MMKVELNAVTVFDISIEAILRNSIVNRKVEDNMQRGIDKLYFVIYMGLCNSVQMQPNDLLYLYQMVTRADGCGKWYVGSLFEGPVVYVVSSIQGQWYVC